MTHYRTKKKIWPGKMLEGTWTWDLKGEYQHDISGTVNFAPPSSWFWACFFLLNWILFTSFTLFVLIMIDPSDQSSTSFLLVLKMPPVSFGGVITTIRHGLIKSRLDSMDSRKLKTQNIRHNEIFHETPSSGDTLKILTTLELITVPRSGAWYTTPAMM